MITRWISAVLAVLMLVGFITPVVLKLKEVSLGMVIAIGLVMMLIDLRQSLRDADS